MLQQIFTLSFMTAFLAAAVRLAVPLMYGGIGETIAEKSGILNIGMEGVMLSGAFFSLPEHGILEICLWDFLPVCLADLLSVSFMVFYPLLWSRINLFQALRSTCSCLV